MKKLLLLLSTFGIAVYLNTPILKVNEEFVEDNVQLSPYNEISSIEVRDIEIDPTGLERQEALQKMYDISTIPNEEEWFVSYKQIIDDYKDVIDPPLTIYDYLTDEEIYLIQRTVETECYDQDFMSKCNVASVVMNRIEIGGEFGSTIKEVITKENQFAYWRKDITESTVLAVEYAYQIEDTTGGCIAFRSGELPKEWLKWVLVFVDDAGHGFYKFKEE